MSWLHAGLRALRTRGAVVVGLFVVAALAAGASSVIAGGSPGRPIVPRSAAVPGATTAPKRAGSVIVGHSYRNTRSRPLRLIPAQPLSGRSEQESNPNPSPAAHHQDAPDAVRQTQAFAPNMPSTDLSFDGIAYPGFNCNCSPPDTNGEVGPTQYVQVVNQGFQVFSKATGATLYGPADIATLWSGFGGVCETSGSGDPVVVYDQLADRWLISQFAGTSVPTDECIAVSTGPSATGAWNRYAFHLGNDFFDYPKLGVWPDAYYLAMNVFNSAGTAYRGPQPFAFDRAAMLAGRPATFITSRVPAVFNSANDPMLPADLDGTTPPAAGAPEPFLMSGTSASWKLWRFHVDFVAPASSSFTLGGSLAPAAYSLLCPSAPCVPQLGTSDPLDALGDRGMFRLAYRNFGDHEALVGNQSVSVGGVGGTRWYELNHASSGTPAFTQQSTYAPADGTWRWMGSAAMDGSGDLALGFSASSATIHPQIRYAGRLAGDTANTLAQGEAHLFDGAGSQTDPQQHFRWGDYSDLTVDPVNDCSFWYTSEYYAVTASNNWRTRIGDFSFPSCGFSSGAHLGLATSAEAPSVPAGSPIDFDLTLRNSGPDAASGIALSDDLPAGSDVDWSIAAASSDPGWSISGSPPNESLVAPASLAGNTSSHVHLVSSTTAGSCGDYAQTASVSSTVGGSDSASASTTVNCLALAESADATSVPGGSPLGYTITLTNSGSIDASGLSVSDQLPAGSGLDWSIDASGSSPGWSVSGAPPNESLVAPAMLAAGTSSHVHLVSPTTSASSGTYVNTVTAASSVGPASAVATTQVSVCAMGEGFADVGNLPEWFMQNNSSPLGATGWYQGGSFFSAQAGGADSYVAADYLNVDGGGTISNWLLTPVVTLQNGAQLSFWTRKIDEFSPDFFPDRLQVRLSTSGSSTQVGSTATSVGDFTGLLLDINPTYTTNGYPFTWTKYIATVSGLGASLSGRFAFRYFVENGGVSGTNSDYIGIDSAAYSCSPPPSPPPPPPPPPPPLNPHSLTVIKSGEGLGTVTSSPAGINCGTVCLSTFAGGTAVTLTAVPAPGSRFLGWSGNCAGTSTCTLTLASDQLAVATFAAVPPAVRRCTVPRLLGLTLKKARGRILSAHCTVGKITKRFSTRKKRRRVVAQKPRPGTRLAARAKVSLTLGKGPRR